MAAIRTTHPERNVTPINNRSCALIDFARDGHATLKLQAEGSCHLSRASYATPPTMQNGPGTSGEAVKYEFYNITFGEEVLQFYAASWRERYYGQKMMFFILSPKLPGQKSNRPSTVVDSLIPAASKWTSELHGEIWVYDNGEWGKDTRNWDAVRYSTWDDIILATKDTLIADVQSFFDNRPLYQEYAIPWKQGAIFYGAPGCGKTMSIKALMNSLHKREPPVASLYVKTLETRQGPYYGIREIFVQARKTAPCLLVFENLDSSLVVEKVRSYFLNELEGLEDNHGILMIGSTNHLNRLGPGISKLFDRKYHFTIPNRSERVLYCENWMNKLARKSNIGVHPSICDVVAGLTDGFSFAYLEKLFLRTLLVIAGGNASELNEDESHGTKNVSFGGSKPFVDVPAYLETNLLMRALHKQAQGLWKDIDSAKDGKVTPSCNDEGSDPGSSDAEEGSTDSDGG